MHYLLAANNTLVVRGPASIKLLGGDASIFGAPLDRNVSMIIRREKQLPIEASAEADIEVTIGESGEIFEVEGSTIPKSWKSAADTLSAMNHRRVMIIGGTDVGKSSLCTYLTNMLLADKTRLGIVDGDVGQADLGPPTTIARAVPTKQIPSLQDLRPDAIFFLGHTTPSPVEAKLIAGMQRLSDMDDRSLTIINTDGWVLDPEAIVYKVKMIHAIKPDIILAMSLDTELELILSAAGVSSLKVEAPKNILMRSRSDRRANRTARYRAYLVEGDIRTYLIDEVDLRLPHQLTPGKFDLRNLILGLLDERGFLVQIGILLAAGKDAVRVYSEEAQGIKAIDVGYVKLSTEGVELGYLDL